MANTKRGHEKRTHLTERWDFKYFRGHSSSDIIDYIFVELTDQEIIILQQKLDQLNELRDESWMVRHYVLDGKALCVGW